MMGNILVGNFIYSTFFGFQIKDLPRPLFQCHELRVLSLSDNEITALPPAIASLINLENLDLSKNSKFQSPNNLFNYKK